MMMFMVSLHVALHTRALGELLSAWAALHGISPHATPFGSAAWAEAWWPHFARGGEPFIIVVRDGDEIVGLAPLVRRRRGPLRVLEGIGIEPGDYWDVLAAPDRREEVAGVVVAELMRRAGEWDAWLLRCPPVDSPLEAALDRDGLRAVHWPRIAAPAIDLPDSFDEYLGHALLKSPAEPAPPPAPPRLGRGDAARGQRSR